MGALHASKSIFPPPLPSRDLCFRKNIHQRKPHICHATNMQRSTMVTAAAMIAVAICLVGGSDARFMRQLSEYNQKCATVVDVMKCDKTFGILKTAVKEAGLLDALTAEDADITVFAPTNKAFAAALEQLDLTKEELLKSDALADILKYHVVPGKIKSEDIQEGETTIETLFGSEITIKNEGDVIYINNAAVEYADLEAENGIVHVIDAVLVPPQDDMIPEGEEDEEGDEEEQEEEKGDVLG